MRQRPAREPLPGGRATASLHPDHHTPQDDVAAIDVATLERVARLAFRVAWRVAEADVPPVLTTAPTPEP